MIVVIGCGNSNRRDDGAGPEVLRLLRDCGLDVGPERLRLLDAGTDGMAVMFAARGCMSLIIIDACRSGSTPGAIFEAPGAEFEQRHQPMLNLHDFRWDHALYAGRRIFGDAFPADVTVLLIEAGDIGFGVGLTPPVAQSVTKVAVRVADLIELRLRALPFLSGEVSPAGEAHDPALKICDNSSQERLTHEVNLTSVVRNIRTAIGRRWEETLEKD